MKCQTTHYDQPCNAEATHFVQGRIVKPHYTCAYHARCWQADATKDNPVEVTEIEPWMASSSGT